MAEYKTYDEVLEEAFRQAFKPEKLLPEIMERKFREKDITLTKEQRQQIVCFVKEGGTLDIDLTEEQLIDAGIEPDEEGEYHLVLDLTDVAERLDKFEDDLPALLDELLREYAYEEYQYVFSVMDSMLSEEDQLRDDFLIVLRDSWGKSLDQLRALIILAADVGSNFATRYLVRSADDSKERDYVGEVLVALHVRACQVAREVYVLLREGLADGAHARWRSLHEISVISKFVLDNGQEVAKRYLDYNWIESRKAAKQHAKYASRLSEPPPTREELRALDKKYQELRKKYGKAFVERYGWAAEVLKPAPANFAEIEKTVGLDHLRPYYRLASHNVHAESKGILFRLSARPPDITLVAGSSIFGLADPGFGAALSLLQTTVWLISYDPTLDGLVKVMALLHMLDEIGDSFFSAHANLEEE